MAAAAARRSGASGLSGILRVRGAAPATTLCPEPVAVLPDFLGSKHTTCRIFSTSNGRSLLTRANSLSSGICFWPQRGLAYSAAAVKHEASDSKISIGPKREELEKDDKEAKVVYEGPISSTIKKVKLLSLSTCCLSVSLGPVITFMTSPDMNVILKGGVASTVIILSASTTAALHWFVSPYIHKLRWKPGADSVEAEMMSWLATPIPKTIKFADVRHADTQRPFVTFEADRDYYFVDEEHFQNKALLARLTPAKSQQSNLKNL